MNRQKLGRAELRGRGRSGPVRHWRARNHMTPRAPSHGWFANGDHPWLPPRRSNRSPLRSSAGQSVLWLRAEAWVVVADVAKVSGARHNRLERTNGRAV